MSDTCRLTALSLPPGPAFVEALRAAHAAGDAVLPLDPGVPAGHRQALLHTFRPHQLITAEGVTQLPDAAPIAADVGVVISTSGSTGAPKGVELTHAALDASADATITHLGLGGDDTWLCCLPVSHIAGLQTVLRADRAGAPVVVHPAFDVEAVANAPADVVSLVPTQLARLLDAGADVSRFRWILLGGAGAPEGLRERAEAAGARIVQTYGMSEMSGGCVYDGLPLAGAEADVDPAGHIRLRGAMRFSRYRLDPARTAAAIDADGWYLTGDLGHWEVDGLPWPMRGQSFRPAGKSVHATRPEGGNRRLVVTGRGDDVIVTGGENVPTGAVAEVLRTHPAVADVAVVGRPDAEWGHRVVAVIVPRRGVAVPDLAELRAWMSSRAPRAYAPLGLEVVDALPRLANGKVDRQRLIDGAM